MGDKNRKVLLIGLGGTLWLLAVLLGYAYTHKPFSPEQIFVVGKSFWRIIVVVSFLSLAGGIGLRILPVAKEESQLTSIAIQAALGLGLLGLLILGLGVSFGFSLLSLTIFLLAGLFLFYKQIIAWWGQWSAFHLIFHKNSAFEKILSIGVLLILLITFAKSLAPPLAFDSLVYHLTLPKFYLFEGSIRYTDDLMYWGMPQIVEMLYTFVMAFAGAEAATLLGWGFGLLTLIGIFGYLQRAFSSLAAWVALVALLVGSSLSESLSWGYVEWLLMLFSLSIFILLDIWASCKEDKFLYFAAFLTGCAVGTKYTAAILPFALSVVLLLINRGRGFKRNFRDLALFASFALLSFSPWLIKNWIATGNPVYPLLFPAGAMDSARVALHQGHETWGGWQDFLFLPWRATIWGIKGKIGYSAEIGPLLLGLSVFSWLNWKEYSKEQKRVFIMAITFASVYFFFWAVAGRLSLLLLQSRLYFSFFPIWAMLAGLGFERFYSFKASGVRFGRIGIALVILSFSFTIFETATGFAHSGVMDVLLGGRTPASYREQTLGKYESAMSIIAELPSDDRVLMLWEPRGFACYPFCEPDEVIDRWYIDLNHYGSREAVLDSWHQAGYTYLFYNKSGADFVRNDEFNNTEIDWESLDALLRDLSLVKDFDEVYKLYKLAP